MDTPCGELSLLERMATRIPTSSNYTQEKVHDQLPMLAIAKSTEQNLQSLVDVPFLCVETRFGTQPLLLLFPHGVMRGSGLE